MEITLVDHKAFLKNKYYSSYAVILIIGALDYDSDKHDILKRKLSKYKVRHLLLVDKLTRKTGYKSLDNIVFFFDEKKAADLKRFMNTARLTHKKLLICGGYNDSRTGAVIEIATRFGYKLRGNSKENKMAHMLKYF